MIRLAVTQHEAWEADPLAAAQVIISEAEHQAREATQRILSDGHARAAAVEETAYAEGFRQGRIDSILAHLSLGTLQATLVASAQEALVNIVDATCREILKTELSVQRHGIAQRVQAVVEQYPQFRLELCANESDIELLKQEFMRLEPAVARRAQSISFTVDPLLQLGSVRLETEFGHLLAAPREHLQAIADYLRQPGEAFAQFVTALLQDRPQAEASERQDAKGRTKIVTQGRADETP